MIKTNIFVLAIRLQDVFKTFSRRPQDFFKTSCEEVFKTSSRNVFKTSSRHLAKASWRRLQNVFANISSMHLQDVLQRYLQDVLKMFIRLNCFPRSRICLRHIFEKVMVSVKNLRVWQKVSQVLAQLHGFRFLLYYIFQWLLKDAFLEPGRTSTRKLFRRKYLTALSR